MMPMSRRARRREFRRLQRAERQHGAAIAARAAWINRLRLENSSLRYERDSLADKIREMAHERASRCEGYEYQLVVPVVYEVR